MTLRSLLQAADADVLAYNPMLPWCYYCCSFARRQLLLLQLPQLGRARGRNVAAASWLAGQLLKMRAAAASGQSAGTVAVLAMADVTLMIQGFQDL